MNFVKMKKCCICGGTFLGYGNNPAPVKTEGVCCDYCNARVVIPTRILLKNLKENNVTVITEEAADNGV